MSQVPQAAGSLWNVNSWHWEMKNISEVAKKQLEQKLLNYQTQTKEGLKVTHSKIVFTKADAQINIRKGKPIFVFEFDLKISVSGDLNGQHCEGNYHAREILNDSLDDIVIDNIQIKQKNKTAEETKKWIKKNAQPMLEKIINELQKQLLQKESDPKKLEEDKKKREENQKATQKAKEETGALKEQLLQEQKQKELKLKQEAQLQFLEEYQSKNPPEYENILDNLNLDDI